MGDILQDVSDGDRSIIHAFNAPIQSADGIQVLYGNIAPKGALVKTSAVPLEQRQFTGIAKVFNSEEACYEAFKAKSIHSGDILVIRYEGPKGGPGMRELHRVTEILKGIAGTAVITDGRFSGASGGLSIGCISPEAYEGGPIALIQDGDTIHIDLTAGTINLALPQEEMNNRNNNLEDNDFDASGYLKRYANNVGCARKGAILE